MIPTLPNGECAVSLKPRALVNQDHSLFSPQPYEAATSHSAHGEENQKTRITVPRAVRNTRRQLPRRQANSHRCDKSPILSEGRAL